ncbi:hypothetical protein CDD81_7101 [Ophiocordyceps australis]|uniref:DUF952 domain-containing protein n=1 Tax=Ophiocordyceps australis TaxID=1399860 RepID=A0A2C5Y660_9HYPO|nr:hypothetical protein CDD81_7101 [Ophiocordyceps australis]
MAQINNVKFAFKIVSDPPPEPLPEIYPKSELDQSDGFVHLSTAIQVPLTADRFFAAHQTLWVLKLDFEKMADLVKWENDFPHLYSDFGAQHIVAVHKVERAHDHSWDETMHSAPWLE